MHLASRGGRRVMVYDGLPVSIYQMLHRTVRQVPEKAALVDNWGRFYSYHTFLQLVNEFAALLQERFGVTTGTHVGLMLYNSVEFCVAFFAVSQLRAVAVPLPSKYQRPEVVSLADKADVEVIVCDEAFAEWFDDCARPLQKVLCRGYADGYGFAHLFADGAHLSVTDACQPEDEDTAVIMFTSGTTTMSKGVVLKNYNITHTVEVYRRVFHITGDDRSMIATPIYHVTGTIALLSLFLYVGGTLWILNKVDPVRVLGCIRDNGLTFFHASPTVYHLLLEHREAFPELPTLDRLACGSSNMPIGSIR